jgi:hypothetical protein
LVKLSDYNARAVGIAWFRKEDYSALLAIGESVRIDVHALDDVAVSFEFLLQFFRTLFPLFPGAREFGRRLRRLRSGQLASACRVIYVRY